MLSPCSSQPNKKSPFIFIGGFKSKPQSLEYQALNLVEKITGKNKLLRCFDFVSISPTDWAFGN